MVCYVAGDRRVSPNLMACSRISHGNCSRCGTVGASHFKRGFEPAVERTPEEERRALRAEFFAQKGRYPTKAQQKRFLDGL